MPPMAKVIKKIGWNHRLIDRASRLLEPYLTTQVSNPLLAERKIAQVYDDAFFQYKDGFNTHFLVQLEHCVFYLKIDAIMQIGFFDYPEISDLQKGLKALKRVATKLGCNEILFQVNPDTRQHQGLSTVLADQQSWLIGYLWLQNPLQINAFGFNFADLDTY